MIRPLLAACCLLALAPVARADDGACELLRYAMFDAHILSHWQPEAARYMREHCGAPGFADFQMRKFCAAWSQAGGDKRNDCPPPKRRSAAVKTLEGAK